MRYNQPLQIGAAHVLMEDDVYEGYFLPKGEYNWCPDNLLRRG